MLATGLRVQEIVEATWSEIDFEDEALGTAVLPN